MEKKIKKRTRKNKIEVSLNDQELQKLKENLKKAGIKNREYYARKMLLDGYIIVIDQKPIDEIARLVRISANNINQVAKRANETGTVYERDVRDLLDQWEKLYPLIAQARNKIVWLTSQ
ncbi:MAG: plasmid mobilization relaxosome protein MobC [Defluviitaleaceae bacterium]|nr:plasmid mobilization relaxosome protein MobC [Defluviitaleaceae bacterium]